MRVLGDGVVEMVGVSLVWLVVASPTVGAGASVSVSASSPPSSLASSGLMLGSFIIFDESGMSGIFIVGRPFA